MNNGFNTLSNLQSLNSLERCRSNVSVSEEERREVLSLINDATDELTSSAYDAQPQDLKNEREVLKSQIRLAHSLLAPIRKLPAEVLSEIFARHDHANYIQLEGFFEEPEDVSFRHQIPGLTLNAVCSFWRKTAQATLSLWTDIMITLGEPRDSTVALVKLLLQYSLNADLDVSTRLPWGEVGGQNRANIPFNLLCEQSYRWRSFHGVVDGTNPHQSAALTSIRGSLGHLRELRISARNSDDIPTQWREVFAICPRLTHISSSQRVVTSKLKLPTEQITHVDFFMNEFWYQDVIQFPNIRCLEITSVGLSNYAAPVHCPTFTSPFLQKLTCNIQFSATLELFQSVFECGIFPQLQTLVIDNPDVLIGYPQFRLPELRLPVKKFERLLERSRCNITTLSITNVVLCPALIDMLYLLPTLTDFILHPARAVVFEGVKQEDTIACRIIRDMTVHSPAPSSRSDRTILLPQLTSLEIHCVGDPSLRDEIVLAMVQSRWPPARQDVSTLKSFKLHRRDRSFGTVFAQTMIRMKLSGLLVSIKDLIGDIEVRDWE